MTNDVPDVMHTGAIIAYTIRPMRGLKVRWTTEITHADAPGLFVDDSNQYCCSNARKAGS